MYTNIFRLTSDARPRWNIRVGRRRAFLRAMPTGRVAQRAIMDVDSEERKAERRRRRVAGPRLAAHDSARGRRPYPATPDSRLEKLTLPRSTTKLKFDLAFVNLNSSTQDRYRHHCDRKVYCWNCMLVHHKCQT